MKYIQSFYNYAVTFSSIEKGIPAKNADGDLRNIAEITDEEFEKLQNAEPLFRQLVDLKKYRVLNKLPESYKPTAVLVNEARTAAASAQKENEELKAKIAELEAKTNEETSESEESEEKTSSKKSKASKK